MSSRLLIDVGNSRVKWAVSTDDGVGLVHAVEHAELAVALRAMTPQLSTVGAVGICDVRGGDVRARIDQWLAENHVSSPVVAVSEESRAGVRNGYAIATQLGADRWMAMIGAWISMPTASLVADVGTAMTLDAIDHQGRHLGGFIVPGPSLMVESTSGRTTGVFASMGATDRSTGVEWPDNTVDAIASGSAWAASAAIEQAYRRLRHQQPDPVKLWLTGGAAEAIEAGLTIEYEMDDALVLRGLDEITRKS